MSDDQRGGSGGFAFVVVGLILLLGVVGLGVGGAAVYRARLVAQERAIMMAEMAEADQRAAAQAAMRQSANAPVPQNDYGYTFRPELVTRQEDGSYKILISGSHGEPTQVKELHFAPSKVASQAAGSNRWATWGDCREVVPSAPYRETIDLVIYTPPLPADAKRATLELSYRIVGTRGGGESFDASATGKLEIDLSPKRTKAE